MRPAISGGLPSALVLFTTILVSAVCSSGPAQAEPLRIVERSDWSRWRDGFYLGHAWREARATLLPSGAGDTTRSAEWFLFEETLRDQRIEAKALDESGSTRVELGRFGAIGDDGTSPIPSLRGLADLARSSSRSGMPDPSLATDEDPARLLPMGASFVAPGLRVLRLRDAWHRLPFLAEYRVVGRGSYANRPTITIKALFATRLARKDGELAAASGRHELDLALDAATGLPLFIRDVFDDSFAFSDGGSERMAGSTLVFWSGGDRVGRGELLADVGKALGAPGGGSAAQAQADAVPAQAPISGSAQPPFPALAQAPEGTAQGAGASSLFSAGPGEVEPSGDLPPAPSPDLVVATASGSGIEVGQGSSGLTLRLPDLRFAADSAVLLPAETARLDLVAKALLAAPTDRTFLVEGFAASTGKPQGELELSSLRAKAVVDSLVGRGIPASRFVWRGLGSGRPLAPNDSEAGRARNRRVEITILD